MGEAVREHVHLKPQIAERTRQRKWAALRKFVSKSKDALKRKKNTSAGTQQQSLGKAVSFLSLLATEAREGNHSSIVYTKTSRENKTGFFLRFFAFREDWERCGCVICLNDAEAGFWGACNIHMQENTRRGWGRKHEAERAWWNPFAEWPVNVCLSVIVWL